MSDIIVFLELWVEFLDTFISTTAVGALDISNTNVYMCASYL